MQSHRSLTGPGRYLTSASFTELTNSVVLPTAFGGFIVRLMPGLLSLAANVSIFNGEPDAGWAQARSGYEEEFNYINHLKLFQGITNAITGGQVILPSDYYPGWPLHGFLRLRREGRHLRCRLHPDSRLSGRGSTRSHGMAPASSIVRIPPARSAAAAVSLFQASLHALAASHLDRNSSRHRRPQFATLPRR